LESSNAAVAKIFRSHSTLQISTSNVRNIMEHTKFMLSMMDRIVDGENGIDYELRKIGAAHAKLAEEYGMGTVELERFGEILVDAFSKLDGVRQSKETSKAWRILIASIIDNVRVGFDTELRVQRRKASFSTISRSSDRRRSIDSRSSVSQHNTWRCNTPMIAIESLSKHTTHVRARAPPNESQKSDMRGRAFSTRTFSCRRRWLPVSH